MSPGESANDEVKRARREWAKGKERPEQRPMKVKCPLVLLGQSIGLHWGQHKLVASEPSLGHCVSW